jgi:Putative HNHc nuclease
VVHAVVARSERARERRWGTRPPGVCARLDALRRPEQSSSEQVPQPAPQAERSSHGNDAVVLPKVTRQRDRQHLRFIIKQPCLVCGRQPCDPHHLRFAQARGLGQKVSDEFTVPLCRAHHRELHRAGTEGEWWSRLGIEPLQAARTLWLATHPSSVA